MKKLLIGILTLAVIVLAVWYFAFRGKSNNVEPETHLQALNVSAHSDSFNLSVQKVLDAYYGMTENFVNWDLPQVNSAAGNLEQSLDSLQLGEMQKDTMIYPLVEMQWNDLKAEVAGLKADETIGEKRASLNMLSQQLYDFLRTIRYDLNTVYYQECPMALNNYEMAGNWLSSEKEVRNPYLGMNDPKYGKKMLGCGETKDSIHYTAQTTSPQ